MKSFHRPKLVYTVLVVLIVGCFALSAVGNGNNKATHGASYWIGAIGWVGFLVAIAATILYSATLLVLAARRRNHASA